MENVYEDVRELIGNTPILQINHMGVKPGINVYAKLELMNPAGSVKDRIGVYMIEDAKQRGLLKEGGTIVDATAGNTGIGIAIAAINQGFKVIFTVPTKFSIEKQQVMKALGAEIIHTPREEGMLGAERKAEEILKETEGAVSLRQFRNPANPLAHYETTGPEIYRQLDGKIDYFVAGAGSGGTFTGVAKFLKESDKVASVTYPGLEGDKYYELSKKYMPNGGCGVVSFELKGGRAAAEKFMKNLKLAAIETHVADARTCCLNPATSTHRQLTPKQLEEAGIPEGLVRMSCGIEDKNDLVADIAQALDAI